MKFGHRLACASRGRDAWWSTSCLHYKELKKVLKMHTAPSETEGAFLSTLVREVQKVNAFFLAAEARFGSELEQLLQQSDQLEQQFLVLLRKHQLDGDGAHVSRQRIILAAREPAEACSSPEAAALASFFALCEDIDSLRKFAFLNIQAVTKILKKHDKTSLIRLRDSLVAFVEKQPICTSVHVVAIWKRSQLLMQELFAAVPRCGPGGEEELACTICGEAPGQFACLPCSHSFCDECMPASMHDEKSSTFERCCPICDMGTCQVAGHSAAAAGASDAAHAQGAQPLRERPDGSNAKHASAEDEGAAQLSLLQRAEQAQRHEQQRLPRLEPGPRHADASGAEGTAGTDGGALSLVVGNGDGVGSACGGRGDERSAIDGGADRSEERERRDTQEEEAEVALMLMRSAQGAFALAAREGEASSEAGRQRSGCAIGSRRQGGAHSSSSADPRAAMVARLMLNDASTNGAPPLAQASADLAAAREHRDPSLGPQATVAGAALVAADAAAVAGAPPHSRERAAVWPVGASAASPAGAEPASAVPASAAPAAAFGAPAAAGAATPAEPQPGLGRTLKPGGQRKQACAKCHSAKAACEGYPCRRCARLGMQCFFPEQRSKRARQTAEEREARRGCEVRVGASKLAVQPSLIVATQPGAQQAWQAVQPGQSREPTVPAKVAGSAAETHVLVPLSLLQQQPQFAHLQHFGQQPHPQAPRHQQPQPHNWPQQGQHSFALAAEQAQPGATGGHYHTQPTFPPQAQAQQQAAFFGGHPPHQQAQHSVPHQQHPQPLQQPHQLHAQPHPQAPHHQQPQPHNWPQREQQSFVLPSGRTQPAPTGALQQQSAFFGGCPPQQQTKHSVPVSSQQVLTSLSLGGAAHPSTEAQGQEQHQQRYESRR